MRLGTARHDGADRVALAVGTDRALLVAPEDARSVDEVIAGWPETRPRLQAAVDRDGARAVPLDRLDWRPPVPRPGKVLCVALNNSANEDRIMSGPDHPATFIKPASSLIGHGQPIRIGPGYGRVHPEPELAVVIGRLGREIPVEDALDHVFGYTVINDLTSPTMRQEDTFHYRAIHPAADGSEEIRYVDSWVSYSGRYKGSDTFGPIGPWITTRDEIPDPGDLTVRCSHQGRVVTEDSTRNLRFSVAEVLAFISGYMSLEPGDIVAMGTALKASAGGGAAVQNIDLARLGGPVSVSISGIGELTNPVVVA